LHLKQENKIANCRKGLCEFAVVKVSCDFYTTKC